MKIALSLLLIALAVLACGCTSTAPPSPAGTATPAAAPQIPALTGTWTGTMAGYDEGTGYTDYGNATMSMNITEQQGRFFSGDFTFRFNGTVSEVPMAGIIARDGRTFSLVEDGNGYTTGEIVGDTILLSHFDDQKPISVAIDTLKRV